jgi:hypothetical protein
MITHSVVESAKLASIRDYLLPRLLSGTVRVSTTASGLRRSRMIVKSIA